MSNAERILEALRAELGNEPEIVLLEAPPAQWQAPAVVVTPGDPFREPATHGLMRERWEILAVVSMRDKASGIALVGELSDRIARAAHSVGGLWRNTSGLRVLTAGDSAAQGLSLAIVRIEFLRQPQEAA